MLLGCWLSPLPSYLHARRFHAPAHLHPCPFERGLCPFILLAFLLALSPCPSIVLRLIVRHAHFAAVIVSHHFSFNPPFSIIRNCVLSQGLNASQQRATTNKDRLKQLSVCMTTHMRLQNASIRQHRRWGRGDGRMASRKNETMEEQREDSSDSVKQRERAPHRHTDGQGGHLAVVSTLPTPQLSTRTV